MPTQLPDRIIPKPEPTNVTAWIAGTLAIMVLIGVSLRPSFSPDMGADIPDPNAPPHMVRIVLAHAAPVPVTR